MVRRSGIGWLAGRFNWTTWELKLEHADFFLQEDPEVVAHYQRRGVWVRGVQDVYTHLHRVEAWLQHPANIPRQETMITEHLSSLCLAQFRADIF